MYRWLNTARSVKKFVFDRVSAKHHRSCDMDQPICGHPDNHRPVACCHHVHAPEDSSAVNQDHPKIRHVPGRGIGGAATHRPQNNRGVWLRNVCVFSAASVGPESAAERHHQHPGSKRNHRLCSALFRPSQRIQ